MSEELLLTPDERLQELSDLLLANIVCSDTDSLNKRRILFNELPIRVFKDENYILYKVLFSFKDKGITPDSTFLKLYLTRNTRLLNDSKDKIDLSAYEDIDENPYIGYISAVIKQHTRLVGMDKCSDSDFKLAIEKYRVEYSNIEMNKAYATARQILYEGVKIGKKFYQGFSDSNAYIKRVSADIENMIDNSFGDGFIDSREEAVVDDERIKPEIVSDFDLVDELNEHLGGIYTSLLYNIMAPTKGGKSKFMSRIAHTAIVKYGTNISVWAFEGGHQAFWAQLRAIHYEYMYIRNASDPTERVAPLSQKDILLNNYPSEAVRSLEEASRLDLFTNPNYGEVQMINRPFVVENYIEELETSVKVNNSKIVFIDYLQLIESSERGRKSSDIIKEAYKKSLKFCKDRNCAIVTPAQFKQEFIKEMSSSKDGSAPETRTAGGESSEVIRSSDINIALYASIDDLQRREMTIMSVPSRLAISFPAFKIYCDLGSCVFSSIVEDL